MNNYKTLSKMQENEQQEDTIQNVYWKNQTTTKTKSFPTRCGLLHRSNDAIASYHKLGKKNKKTKQNTHTHTQIK